MSELSPEARAVVEAARGGDEPTDGDRSRVRAAVFAAVGLSAADAGTASAATGETSAGGSAGAAAGTGAGSGVVLKVLGGLVLAGAIGFGGWWALGGGGEDGDEERDEVAVVAGDDEAETAVDETETETETETEIEVTPLEGKGKGKGKGGDAEEGEDELEMEPAVVRRAPAPKAPVEKQTDADTLRQETLLVARAQAALNSGDAEGAMAAAAEHRRQFRDGVMAPEREAVEILALCELGRIDDAKTRSARFLARWPKVPAAQRVRGSCGAE